ncbi:hypothetical protein CNMCM7691_009560 [Aspergillus felis]|uniref:Uncharacterized protein n=1 Tax=Aspergillus felis TaxID=1287682 RepID=A0A8H6QY56_9EURO|nr:hypothetical protein CNMCM7691_009560 [Aspergillus felis]
MDSRKREFPQARRPQYNLGPYTQVREELPGGLLRSEWTEKANLSPIIEDYSFTRNLYVHFLRNQRTVPLHASFPEWAYRNERLV